MQNNQPIKRIVCKALPYIKTPFKNKNGVFNFFDKNKLAIQRIARGQGRLRPLHVSKDGPHPPHSTSMLNNN